MDAETRRKITVVATAWGILDKNPEWAGILEHYNLGFPYAWLVHTRAGTLNKKGVEQVEATYTFLLEALGIPESREYHHFLDMTTAVNQP